MSIQYSIDLHVHSTVSDGLETPQELYARAQRQGMIALALSDHDTVAGAAEIEKIQRSDADSPPLRCLPAIELSSGDGGRAHLLGYGVDAAYQPLLDRLEQMQQERAQRSQRMLCLLHKQGIRFSTAVEQELIRPGTGRAHIARALMDAGYVNTMQQAFDRYLARGKCAYIARKYIPISEGVRLLKDAGAVVSLAHPCRLTLDMQALHALIQELMQAGLDGVEAFHPSASRQQAPLLDSMARSLGLLVTGGSDYHGDQQCCVRMGRMPSGWKDPEADLNKLLERIRACSGR